MFLSQFWQRKLQFLSGVKGLKKVKLASYDQTLVIEGEGLGEAFKGIGAEGDDLKKCRKDVKALIEQAQTRVRAEIAERVDRDGWRALRAWVHKGGFQSRAG